MPTLAATALPVHLSPGPLLALAAGVLALIDSAVRFRRPGGSAILSILAVVAGLLLIVAELPPLQPYVTTTIPVLYLAGALAVVLVVELIVKSARRGGILWLTLLTLLVTAAAGVVDYLRIG